MDKTLFFQKVISFIADVHASTHSLTKDARPNAITPQQYSILEYIFFSTPVTTSLVADCLNISLPNASRELKKLSESDFIVKKANKKDRRTIEISLSEKGSNLVLKTFGRIEKNYWKETGQLSDKDMEALVSSMDLLKNKLFHND